MIVSRSRQTFSKHRHLAKMVQVMMEVMMLKRRRRSIFVKVVLKLF